MSGTICAIRRMMMIITCIEAPQERLNPGMCIHTYVYNTWCTKDEEECVPCSPREQKISIRENTDGGG